jgi:hypothetical protein
MDQRDQELDELLEGLRGEQPTEREMNRWRAAILRATKERRRYVWQTIAAALVGIVLGAAGAWNRSRGEEPCINSYSQKLTTENSTADATFELTYVKLD